MMESLAQQLQTPLFTANRFIYTNSIAQGSPIVIDAYDELAKVDFTGIHKLLSKARDSAPSKVLISSRSSEWDNSTTSAFREVFGEEPLVVRLAEFKPREQRSIFEDHAPSEDFEAFHAEVSRFDLETLLPNPQFLKLFADAYIQSDRYFKDKLSIFSQALEKLSREANPDVKNVGGSLSILEKVNAGSEVFAKLLLSGVDGLTTSEANEDEVYPVLASLVSDADSKQAILATRMFKQGDKVERHRPVHKIISEYAAAQYLTSRIADPSDALLLEHCLPIIAPNSTVRDELRGLLGWLASLGNQAVEEAAIELDSYAVLANGDPSQLSTPSKRLLISRLKKDEENDPYFRRGDFGRRFSVAGLFSKEVVKEVRPHLSPQFGGQFQDLVLELLEGTPATTDLLDEIKGLCLSKDAYEHTRLRAARLLLATYGFDYTASMAQLIFQADTVSMKVAAKIIEHVGSTNFSWTFLVGYLRVFANLYPRARRSIERVIGARYFLRSLIKTFSHTDTVVLLDTLSSELVCRCAEKAHDCHCRNGSSKIIGLLLDHYCEISIGPHDPRQIWSWVKNLNFHSSRASNSSTSVKLLQENDGLRQGIMQVALGNETDRERIREIRFEQFEWQSHSGLRFHSKDREFMADLAFEINNVALWSDFLTSHNSYREPEKRGPDKLRRKMRMQAQEKRELLIEWARRNRNYQNMMREQRERRHWSQRRWTRRDKVIAQANRASLLKDKVLIESGQHWSWLYRIAELYLIEPDDLEKELCGIVDPEKVLRNCFDFLSEYVPTLEDVALGNWHNVARVLHAASVAEFRAIGKISQIPKATLEIVKTDLSGYQGVSEGEEKAFEKAIDKEIFSNPTDIESFLRRYIEPQLGRGPKGRTDASWLSYKKEFHSLRGKLSIEWLSRYRALPFETLDTLFNLAANFADRGQLKEITLERCSEIMWFWPDRTEDEELENRRTFWFLRALYFIPNTPKAFFDWLAEDKDTVLAIYHRSGRGNRQENESWPRLNAAKVEALLDAFIGVWPKVHLPSSYGTGSPKGETAYRCLSELVWSISSDSPDAAIPVLNRLISDGRFVEMENDLKSIRASQTRKKSLVNFTPPTPQQVVQLLDQGQVVTVEGLRKLVLNELSQLQAAINGSEFNTAEQFYAGDRHHKEEPCTRRIAERLSNRLEAQDITVIPERHLKHGKRCDFTTEKSLSGKRAMLVTEVKGQWHPQLFSAATEQLNSLYTIHPDAAKQGIYLVLWFGVDVRVAGKKTHNFTSAVELKRDLEKRVPLELKGLINVFVLDVSKD